MYNNSVWVSTIWEVVYYVEEQVSPFLPSDPSSLCTLSPAPPLSTASSRGSFSSPPCLRSNTPSHSHRFCTPPADNLCCSCVLNCDLRPQTQCSRSAHWNVETTVLGSRFSEVFGGSWPGPCRLLSLASRS